MSESTRESAETVELLQALIRNKCVNDGTPESGGERRNVDVLEAFLAGAGLQSKVYEPHPGRASLLARIEGSDRAAPSLLLLAHLDVVPAAADAWQHDPFGGELIGDEVWGRGATDMLGFAASMAAAIRRIARSGRVRGSISFLAAADEEALGGYGAEWLNNNAWEEVQADYVLTEWGGAHMEFPGAAPGPILPVMVGEKSAQWLKIVAHGVSGHASTPLGASNALLIAAEVALRLANYAPPIDLGLLWLSFVAELHLSDGLAAQLTDANRLDGLLPTFSPGLRRRVHAATRTTISPTVMRAGQKTNVLPDSAVLEVDIRRLPGQDAKTVTTLIQEALGPMADQIDISIQRSTNATMSSTTTPLWKVLRSVSGRIVPGSRTVPFLLTGATDGRFFRERGSVVYGYGLTSPRMPFERMVQMFHGVDERIDVESLELSTELWVQAAAGLASV
jgi:acetylornithine deacetylase/succinyl-diaminopimelate desuccinylase-like protein